MAEAVKVRVYQAIIAVLVLLLLGLAYRFIVSGSTAPAADGRTAILFRPGERDLMLGEMREFVAGLQSISQALSRDDMGAVAQAARALGTSRGHDVPVAMLSKLPLGFKKLAFGVHSGFDALAADAQTVATPKHSLQQLSGILEQCVACHAAYQIKVSD